MAAAEEDDDLSLIISDYCMPSLSDMSSASLLTESQYAKVIFHELLPVYPTDADIWCRYSVTGSVNVRHGDRVALYRVGWSSIQDHVHFEVAPVPPETHDRELQVLFKAESLPKDTSEFYQLCYVNVEGSVCGASVPFQFRRASDDELCEEEDQGGMLVVRSRTAINEDKLREANELIADLEKKIADNSLELRDRDELKHKIANLNEQLAELQKTEERLREEIRVQLEAERGGKAKTEAQLLEAKEEAAKLANTVVMLSNEKATLNAVASRERAADTGEMDRLRAQVEDMQLMLDASTQSKEMATRALHREQARVIDLTQHIEPLSRRNEALSAELLSVQAQLVSEVEQLRLQATQERTEVVAKLMCRQRELESDKERLLAALVSLEDEKMALTRSLEQCAGEVSRANDTWVANARTIRALQDEMAREAAQTCAKLATAQSRCDDYRASANRLALQADEAKTDHESRVTEMLDKERKLETDYVMLCKSHEELTSQVNALNETVVKLSDERTRLEASYVAAKHEAQLLQAENARLRKDLAEMAQCNADYRRAMEEQGKEKREREEKEEKRVREEKDEVIASMAAEMERLESEFQRLQGSDVTSNVVQDVSDTRLSQVCQLLATAEESNAHLKAELEQVRSADSSVFNDGDGDEVNALDLSMTVKVMELQNRKANLEIQLAESTANEDVAKRNRMRLVDRLAEIDSEIAGSECLCCTLEQDLNTEVESLRKLTEKMSDLQSEMLRDDWSEYEDTGRMERMCKRAHDLECRVAVATSQRHDVAQVLLVLGQEREDVCRRVAKLANEEASAADGRCAMLEALIELDRKVVEARGVVFRNREKEMEHEKVRRMNAMDVANTAAVTTSRVMSGEGSWVAVEAGEREMETEAEAQLKMRLDMAADEYRKIYVQKHRAEKKLAKLQQKQAAINAGSSSLNASVDDTGYICETCSAVFPLPATALFLSHLEDHMS